MFLFILLFTRCYIGVVSIAVDIINSWVLGVIFLQISNVLCKCHLKNSIHELSIEYIFRFAIPYNVIGHKPWGNFIITGQFPFFKEHFHLLDILFFRNFDFPFDVLELGADSLHLTVIKNCIRKQVLSVILTTASSVVILFSLQAIRTLTYFSYYSSSLSVRILENLRTVTCLLPINSLINITIISFVYKGLILDFYKKFL